MFLTRLERADRIEKGKKNDEPGSTTLPNPGGVKTRDHQSPINKNKQ
jgi:hypothetical protein